jgi:hypothetical protein
VLLLSGSDGRGPKTSKRRDAQDAQDAQDDSGGSVGDIIDLAFELVISLSSLRGMFWAWRKRRMRGQREQQANYEGIASNIRNNRV